ncbi:MAG TPA: hypothetical protein ENG63_05310 [Candidatus Desulfofervidus auxilii]|uniref:Site-2 protease family protein n=1 Tax=Desulfofervidus auxilii TaxID=1621989 RepID=A0A7C0Y4N1_DESA2|nr:hypothetical protein [Candidatus Desulfofervidus auxilii]
MIELETEGILTKLVKDLRKRTTIPQLLFSLIVGFIAVNLSLLVHESSHVIVARLLGVEAGISQLMMFTGMSSIGETTPMQFYLIALAGPIGAFLYGLWCYFFEKDSIIRVAGIVSFFYSVLPSLAPFMPGSDMAQIIAKGFNPLLGWIIYLLIFGYCFKLVIQEVIEGKWKKYL